MPPPPLDRDQRVFAATVLGSATSGMLSRIPCHPLDTVKARLQASSGGGGASGGLLRTLLAVGRSEGLAGLYRGFGVAFAGSAPAAMLYFVTYEQARDALPLRLPAFAALPPAATHITAGLLAEAVSCVLWVPIDVIKERMQVQGARGGGGGGGGGGMGGGGAGGGGAGGGGTGGGGAGGGGAGSIAGSVSGGRGAVSGGPSGAHDAVGALHTSAHSPPYYRNTLDALRQIVRAEGPLGVYRGYGATLASFGPFSALYFALYESMKGAVLARRGGVQGGSGAGGGAAAGTTTLPLGWQITTACAAGGLASALTNPLDLVKLRLQVQRGAASVGGSADGSQPYRSLAHGLRRVVAEEGWRALFRGAGARVAFHAPATAVSMTAFETCKAAYLRLLLPEEA